jgi:hypothetical protein
MLRPFLSDILYVPIEDPPSPAPIEVFVIGAAPRIAPAADASIIPPDDAPAAPAMPAMLPAPPPQAADADAVPAADPPLPDGPQPADSAQAADVPPPDAAQPADAVPDAELPPPPAFALPPEDAFPTLAELDAIRAANAGPPPGPDAAERAEMIALLGLDPALAADPERYATVIAGLPAPDADALLADWLRDAEAEIPSWKAVGDWQVG